MGSWCARFATGRFDFQCEAGRRARRERQGRGKRQREAGAFTSAVRVLRYGRGNLRAASVCGVSRLLACTKRTHTHRREYTERKLARAHAVPAHIRIVMATFPVVCRAREGTWQCAVRGRPSATVSHESLCALSERAYNTIVAGYADSTSYLFFASTTTIRAPKARAPTSR